MATIFNQTLTLQSNHLATEQSLHVQVKQSKKPLQPRKAEAKRKQAKPPVAPKAAPQRAVLSSHEKLLQLADIPKSVWGCAEDLVQRESGWRVDATNVSSGAYGLPQSLPASKMASAGADYLTNPITQLKWADGYVKERYGGWCQANSFQLANSWY